MATFGNKHSAAESLRSLSVADKGVLLTVAYPTCNRAPYLKQSIESLVAVVEESLLARIQVLVCDNSDNEETKLVVQNIINCHPINIRYIKNPVNIGAGLNGIQCFKESLGSYIHVLSDQALFRKEYSRLLRYLQCNGEAGVIHFNYSGRDNVGNDANADDAYGVVKYTAVIDVVSEFHKNLTHLSSLIFKRDAIDFSILDLADVRNSLIPQTHILLDSSSRNIFVHVDLTCVSVFPRRVLNYDFLEVFCRDYIGLVRRKMSGRSLPLSFLFRYSLWLTRMELALDYPHKNASLRGRIDACVQGYGRSAFVLLPISAVVFKHFFLNRKQ